MSTRAALYARLSLDRNGTGASVDRQLEDCRALALSRGWDVVAEHQDNSRSAWRRDRQRPGWDAMLGQIERGDVDAVVVYHGDRLVRQPRDLEQLITAVEQRNVLVASPSGTRDLGNADDRFIVRVETAAACRESDSISRRVRRVFKENAEAGKRHGRIPYGWRAPEEAEVVRRIVLSILGGESVNAVARALNTEGVPAAGGGRWYNRTVRQMAMRWANAGLREHKGEVMGEAQWPALVTQEQQEQVIRRLSSNAPPLRAVSKHLLTGLLVCGVCGTTLRHKHPGQRAPQYACPQRHVAIRADLTEQYVLTLVQARLAAPDALEASTPRDDKHAALTARLDALRGRLDGLAQDYADGILDREQVRVAGDRLRGEVAEVEARLAEDERRHTVLAYAGLDLLALTPDRQRSIITALVRLTVEKGTSGARWDPERITVQWVN